MALAFTSITSAQTKQALLVAISNYSTNSAKQWSDIHGANDAGLIATTLKSSMGAVLKYRDFVAVSGFFLQYVANFVLNAKILYLCQRYETRRIDT